MASVHAIVSFHQEQKIYHNLANHGLSCRVSKSSNLLDCHSGARPWFSNSTYLMNQNEGAAKTKVHQDPHLPFPLDISWECVADVSSAKPEMQNFIME